jgi:TIR domain
MHRIFISYRRDDSASDMTDRVYERLVRRWGGRVFMDIDSLTGGDLFANEIEENLQSCAVVLVMIGHYWASLTGEKGTRRIDNPLDYPRIEVSAALKRNVRIIPVLVGGASLPKREDLPQDIIGLLDREVVRISREDFDADMQRLMAAVAREMPRRSWREMPWQAIGIATLFVCFGTAAYLEFARKSTQATGDVRAVLSPVSKKNELGPVPTNDPETAVAKTATSELPDSTRPTSFPNVSGRWSTPTIRNVYSPNEQSSVLFEFTQEGSMLQGRVIETNEGETGGVSAPIIDGKIVNNVISFYTKGEYSGSNETAVPYKEMYTGVIKK